MLQRNLFLLGDLFEPIDDVGVITAAVRQRWAVANLDAAMHLLVYGRIIGGVGHIDNDRDVRL